MTVAADPLGLRSVYVCGKLRAPELRDLLARLDRAPEPDPEAVRGWLARGTLPADRTLYRGIGRLRPGQALDGTRSEHPRPAARAGDPATLVRAAVVAAVERCVAPRERAGVLLSGGLDSTVVAAVGARALPEDQRPAAHYSVLFPGLAGQDERDWIAATAAELGLHSVRMSVRGGSIVEAMLEWAREQSAPLPAASWFYQRRLLARMAEDGCTAVLDGEGGDEVFAASRQLLADRVRGGRPLRAWREMHRLPNAAAAPARVRVRAFGDYALRGALPYGLHRRLARGDDFEERWAWQRRPGPRWAARLTDVLTDGIARVGAHEHFRLRAARAGLEARHPLFDLELVELVLGLPPELGFDPVLNRPLLRRAMHGMAPDAILRRTGKARFESLIVRVLAGDDLPALRALLGPDALVREYADVSGLADPPATGRAAWADRVFRAAAAECWLRTLADGAFPDRFRSQHRLTALDAVFDG
jgi:asparagine synthase (glutamine-hydrolysing)